MAPLVSDPAQLRVIFNLARRKALYKLVSDIAAHIRTPLELATNDNRPGDDDIANWDDDDDTLYEGEGRGDTSPPRPRRNIPSARLLALRAEAIRSHRRWSDGVLRKLSEIVTAADDEKILEERKKRRERHSSRPPLNTSPPVSYSGDNLISFGDDESGEGPDHIATLQHIYKPIETRLITVPLEDRREAVSAILLLLLSTGSYSAYARTLVLYLTSSLELPLSDLIQEETEIAKSLMDSSRSSSESQTTMSADAEREKRRLEGQTSRYWKVGLASVAGAAVIGLTGGLAAPAVAGAIGGIMGSVGLGGVASFLGIFWMNGALVGTLFGAFGAKMTGAMMDRYAKEVEDFRFIPLAEPSSSEAGAQETQEGNLSRRLKVVIGINGWLESAEQITQPWSGLSNDSEVFALRFEMEKLLVLGQALRSMVSSYAWSMVKVEILRRTVLATLWAALWPAYILSMAAGIDNPFNLAKNRSDKAGKVLADALINKVQGERPVTLIGYSLGARVIYSCLRSLAERHAFDLVETVVLIGAPIPSDYAHWQTIKTAVAGPIFNVYSANDYILGFIYRAHSLQLGVAGLQATKDVLGIEDIDLTESVNGHLRYPSLIPKILTRCGFQNVKDGEGRIEKDDDGSAAAAAVAASAPRSTVPYVDLLSLDDPPLEYQMPAELPASTIPEKQTMHSIPVSQKQPSSSVDVLPSGQPHTEPTVGLNTLPRTAKSEILVTQTVGQPSSSRDEYASSGRGETQARPPFQTSKSVDALPPPRGPPKPWDRPQPQPTGHDGSDVYDSDDSEHGVIRMVDNEN